jgi:hypothetical protein
MENVFNETNDGKCVTKQMMEKVFDETNDGICV